MSVCAIDEYNCDFYLTFCVSSELHYDTGFAPVPLSDMDIALQSIKAGHLLPAKARTGVPRTTSTGEWNVLFEM